MCTEWHLMDIVNIEKKSVVGQFVTAENEPLSSPLDKHLIQDIFMGSSTILISHLSSFIFMDSFHTLDLSNRGYHLWTKWGDGWVGRFCADYWCPVCADTDGNYLWTSERMCCGFCHWNDWIYVCFCECRFFFSNVMKHSIKKIISST